MTLQELSKIHLTCLEHCSTSQSTFEKKGFHWNGNAMTTFSRIEDDIDHTISLVLSKFTQNFVIKCDVSNIGIGAILSQKYCLITYFSKALKDMTLIIFIYEKEMHALVMSTQKCCP